MTDTTASTTSTAGAAESDAGASKAGWWSAIGALLAAVAASACCVLPLVLLGLGVGGAWAGSLSALEPYRPIFAAVTLALLAVGFYFAYRRPRECGEGANCGTPRSRRLTRTGIWVAAVLALAMLAFPYVSPALVGRGTVAGDQSPAAGEQVTLKISGLTCPAASPMHSRPLRQWRACGTHS